ncbi:hypothetical protein [Aquimarina megaterium]|uniref:hypothetical protein n=1 Tax=Aquimarina megaterium TaxID=1443666 RepID=UPI0004AED19E|nr:hypothetical protein [Aquimarina megaterium]
MKYLLLLFALGMTSCSSQSKDCLIFKTGTFKYSDSDDWIITRTDSTQIEVNKKNGRTLKSSIKWLSDCEFVITVIEDNKGSSNILDKKITVKILNTTSKSYHYEATDGIKKIKNSLIKI